MSNKTMTIREAIDRSGMSQREVAKQVGVSQPAVNLWYHGKRSLSSPSVAIALAKLLRVPVDKIEW